MKLPALRDADVHTRLSTYLNDHLGGSAGGVELARRLCRRQQAAPQYGPPLEAVAQPDRGGRRLAAQTIMAPVRRRGGPHQAGGGCAAEKVGRLKLNGQLLGYSPLSRLVELEGMMLGVTGKLSHVGGAERELRA